MMYGTLIYSDSHLKVWRDKLGLSSQVWDGKAWVIASGDARSREIIREISARSMCDHFQLDGCCRFLKTAAGEPYKCDHSQTGPCIAFIEKEPE